MKTDKHLRSNTRTLIAFLISAVSSHAAGIDYLSGKSNIIVVGTVDNRVETPSSVSFTINVARVLIGSLTAASVNVVHPWNPLVVAGTPRTIVTPLTGIWFLTGSGSGSWDVLTARPTSSRTALGLFLPALPTPPSGPYAYSPGTSIVDALVNETAAGFVSATNQDRDPRLLLAAFDQIDSPSVRNVLSNLAASGDLTSQTIALTGALERSIPGSVATLVTRWPSLKNDPNESIVVSGLRDYWRDPTPTSVQQLASFAAGSPTGSDIRAAAIRALAAVHTKETLPFLASLLLSPAESEQEQSVYGLSSFANSCPVQTRANATSGAYLQCDSVGPYKTAQTVANLAFPATSAARLPPLVSFWQSWWNGHPELH